MLIRKQGLWCQGPIITSSRAWMNIRQRSWIFYWVLSSSFNFFVLFFPFSSCLRFSLCHSNLPFTLHPFIFLCFLLPLSLQDIASFITRVNNRSQVIFKTSMSQRLLEFNAKPQKDMDFSRVPTEQTLVKSFTSLLLQSFCTSSIADMQDSLSVDLGIHLYVR